MGIQERITTIPNTPEIARHRNDYGRIALRDIEPGTARYERAQGVLTEEFDEKVRRVREALAPVSE